MFTGKWRAKSQAKSQEPMYVSPNHPKKDMAMTHFFWVVSQFQRAMEKYYGHNPGQAMAGHVDMKVEKDRTSKYQTLALKQIRVESDNATLVRGNTTFDLEMRIPNDSKRSFTFEM